MPGYKPGLHILSTFLCDAGILSDTFSCQRHLEGLITELELNKVGEVFHAFPGGGFTATICLTESHISIHTWPEYQLATFDVFLSNYSTDNSEKAREIYRRTLAYFGAEEQNMQEITR